MIDHAAVNVSEVDGNTIEAVCHRLRTTEAGRG
jgi:hypothetical protein